MDCWTTAERSSFTAEICLLGVRRCSRIPCRTLELHRNDPVCLEIPSNLCFARWKHYPSDLPTIGNILLLVVSVVLLFYQTPRGIVLGKSPKSLNSIRRKQHAFTASSKRSSSMLSANASCYLHYWTTEIRFTGGYGGVVKYHSEHIWNQN